MFVFVCVLLEKFRALPNRPSIEQMKGFGRIIDVIIHKDRRPVKLFEEIRAMNMMSIVDMSIDGNIDSNNGYIIQCHEDKNLIQQDFDKIIAIQNNYVHSSTCAHTCAHVCTPTQSNIMAQSDSSVRNIIRSISNYAMRSLVLASSSYLFSNILVVLLPLLAKLFK